MKNKRDGEVYVVRFMNGADYLIIIIQYVLYLHWCFTAEHQYFILNKKSLKSNKFFKRSRRLNNK